MQQPTFARRIQAADHQAAVSTQPRCPVCGETLIELRGFVRCTRCHFGMCQGCDGGMEEVSDRAG